MSDLWQDEWVRDVAKMMVLWGIATVTAAALMLTFGEAVFL